MRTELDCQPWLRQTREALCHYEPVHVRINAQVSTSRTALSESVCNTQHLETPSITLLDKHNLPCTGVN